MKKICNWLNEPVSETASDFVFCLLMFTPLWVLLGVIVGV